MKAKTSVDQKGTLQIISDPAVEKKFDAYPPAIRKKMNHLRKMILMVAAGTEGLNELHETLKWNEPSFLTRIGSTIRMDWKEKSPNHYALYFKCTSKLIPTFKAKFGNKLSFEGNRAILIGIEDKIPEV
jgi:hypothetical protein